MNKVLYIILISLFSLTIFSCAKEEEKKAPVIAEVYPVTTPTSDPSPDYTFSSTKAGTITYGGSCSSGTTSATSGNNTITFLTLSDGTYSDCTIIVTDSDGNASNTLAITSFIVNTTTDTTRPTAIAAGSSHTCALLDNASVKCWGKNNKGQLGINSSANMGDDSGEMAALPTVNLGTGRTATAIDAGSFHSCALLDNASVKCWGRNNYGQLGINNSANMGDDSGEMAVLPSIDLGTGRTATAIAAGEYHSCALLDNASVKCWGNNNRGQLGINSSSHMGDDSGEMAVLPSIDLGTGRTATAIDAGGSHTCALLDNASVKCWGHNNSGNLGIDNNTNMGDDSGEMAVLPTVNLGTGRTATAIALGYYYSCALLDNASVKCWGHNSLGQLGIDNTTDMGDDSGEMAVLPSIDLGTGRTATAIAAGYYHSCALLDNASVKCWGYNNKGQLGIGNKTTMGDDSGEMAVLPSIDLGTGRTVTAIAAGEYHSCALLDNASVKCWGKNNSGQLGINSSAHMGDGSGEMGDNLPVVDL